MNEYKQNEYKTRVKELAQEYDNITTSDLQDLAEVIALDFNKDVDDVILDIERVC